MPEEIANLEKKLLLLKRHRNNLFLLEQIMKLDHESFRLLKIQNLPESEIDKLLAKYRELEKELIKSLGLEEYLVGYMK